MSKKNINSIINTEGHDNAWWIKNSILGSINEHVLLTTCDSIINLNKKFLINESKNNLNYPCILLIVKPNKNFKGDYIILKNKKIDGISRKRKPNYLHLGYR